MSEILRGKPVADAICEDLIKRVGALKAKGTVPCLGLVRVGENPSDIGYERGLVRRAEKVGVEVKKFVLPADVSQDEVLAVMDEINADSKIHGCLIFRPLPKTLDDKAIRNRLSTEKDMDGITDLAMAGVYSGDMMRRYAPCTAEACIRLLDHYGIDPKGMNVAVVGRSLVIGRPVAMMLMQRNATVTICHTRTVDTSSICKNSEMIIACAGVSKIVSEDYMADGQIIVDVGFNVDEEGNTTGDADFEAAERTVAAVTPVPGGVGDVTSSVLMSHVVLAAEFSRG